MPAVGTIDTKFKDVEADATFPVTANCLKRDGGQYDSYGFYPHPSNCQIYIRCDQVNYEFDDKTVQYILQSGLFEKRCPSGLHFNTKLNVCDWPVNAQCTVNI